MPAPVVTVVESLANDSSATVALGATNPLSFGSVDAGSTDVVPASGAHYPVWIWNDRGGVAGSSQMQNARLTIKDSSGGNTGQIITGTTGNGFQPWVEARSVAASGVAADNQAAFSKIGGNTTLSVGNIPSNAARQVFIQADVPGDATPGTISFNFRVSYQYV